MPKNTNKRKKKQEKFWSDNRFLNWKKLNYFNKVSNPYFSTYYKNCAQTTKLKPNQTHFDGAYSNLTWKTESKTETWSTLRFR